MDAVEVPRTWDRPDDGVCGRATSLPPGCTLEGQPMRIEREGCSPSLGVGSPHREASTVLNRHIMVHLVGLAFCASQGSLMRLGIRIPTSPSRNPKDVSGRRVTNRRSLDRDILEGTSDDQEQRNEPEFPSQMPPSQMGCTYKYNRVSRL
jgi:hypothetical protein